MARREVPEPIILLSTRQGHSKNAPNWCQFSTTYIRSLSQSQQILALPHQLASADCGISAPLAVLLAIRLSRSSIRRSAYYPHSNSSIIDITPLPCNDCFDYSSHSFLHTVIVAHHHLTRLPELNFVLFGLQLVSFPRILLALEYIRAW